MASKADRIAQSHGGVPGPGQGQAPVPVPVRADAIWAAGDLEHLVAQITDLEGRSDLCGLKRSFDVYYRDPVRHAAMDAIYSRFVSPGDLAFDVGSHVGDRIASFRRLGARVVACEPQAPCIAVLNALYGTDPQVSIVPAACGATPGRLMLHINAANPTVSTLTSDFIEAAQDADGWHGQAWTETAEVPVTTLTELIGEHGPPKFVKIDVEGFEAEVVDGLSEPVPGLSFEFTTIQRDVARDVLRKLAVLGPYRYQLALGESHAFAGDEWVGADAMAEMIVALPHEANSGDVYAVLEGAQ